MGEWGKDSDKAKASVAKGLDAQCDRKLDLLAAEGVPFDAKGVLKSRSYLWDGRGVST